MAKLVRKLFGDRPERIAVLQEVADFNEEGIAEVSDEASEVFANSPGYEIIEEPKASEGEGEPVDPEEGEQKASEGEEAVPPVDPEEGEQKASEGEEEGTPVDPEEDEDAEKEEEEVKPVAPVKKAPPKRARR